MKIFGLDLLPMLLPILIKAAKEVIDLVLKGEDLNEENRNLVRLAYYGVNLYYDIIVKDPENTYTDEALDEFLALCVDTAQEGGFALDEPSE